MSKLTYSLYELNEHLRRVIALNYQQPVWITAELMQVGVSRGHYYLDLVQKGEDGEVTAQAQAALWASDFRRINGRFPLGLMALLQEGLELRLQIRPEFHERYGLKLIISDIDPEHTLGRLDQLRRQTIQALREEGLLERNRALELPPVLQRIAVISSETAAGLQDFRRHLEENAFGYRFDCRFFTAAVQGKNVEKEFLEVFSQIEAQKEAFDCVVIVRGGGAKLDLMAFDSVALCRAAAQMPLPLLVGIGHDIDETVLDMVAHSALKTPTAVADFLLQHNLLFESKVLEFGAAIEHFARNSLKFNQMELDRAETTLLFSARAQWQESGRQLDFLESRLPELAMQQVRNSLFALEKIEALCESLDPELVLKRGYSITTHNGKALKSISALQSGDLLETRLEQGMIQSRVV